MAHRQKFSFLLTFSIILLLAFSTSCEKCMRCHYYYYEDKKYKIHEVTECGNNDDLQQFKEAMEYAAEQFDTTASCTTPW